MRLLKISSQTNDLGDLKHTNLIIFPGWTRYVGRCKGEYIGDIEGNNWKQRAIDWCIETSDCVGFMIFDFEKSMIVNPSYCCHDSEYAQWGTRPQFCMESTNWTSVQPNNGWLSYRKPGEQNNIFLFPDKSITSNI